MSDKIQTEYILLNKLTELLYCSSLKQFQKKELVKLNKIAQSVSLQSVIELFDLINYRQITKFNANKLLLFMNNTNNFNNHKIKIKWGPGNYGDDNVQQYYCKHVLSDEGIHWKHILNNEDYRRFAVNIFYKMKDVIVHTNGTNVWLSGFYCKYFIIGRFDDDVFGISSCYYVENSQKPGRYNGFCFDMSF